ncbi:glycosyltransferase family 2 protein [Tropicimonas sp. IMCC6043]|uniref:glycosyltransferase family 2 protein n=1 Tax=Tropicimonas sp. IMCC6043 TaxID=2510645 RepID=UPI00101D1FDA|nr:glycosyltransferase family 2 protein [Tropicimonas sp. IMCC6043]RYH06628.1 glycosyltransferase [Tropicimonas sp. IMCC6043]
MISAPDILPKQRPFSTLPVGRKLSLVVPVFNEEQAVPMFLDKMKPLVRELRDKIERVEVVFVDDGSADRTVAEIIERASDVLDIRIVKLSRNFRKDNALAAGLDHATGDAVIPMDVDLQDPPELIPQMVEAWLDGAKVVNAKRASRHNDSALKRSSSRAFYGAINLLSEFHVEPNVGDFRLLDRQVVDVLNAMPERVRFMKGMFAWVGFRQVTLEYERPERAAGETKWNLWKLWNFALDGITGASTLPLRAWTYFGSIVAVLALIMGFLLTIRTLVYGIDVPGYASLMVVVLFFGACNLIALGILGEYVGRLTVESKRRPIYVVEEVIELTAAEGSVDRQQSGLLGIGPA